MTALRGHRGCPEERASARRHRKDVSPARSMAFPPDEAEIRGTPILALRAMARRLVPAMSCVHRKTFLRRKVGAPADVALPPPPPRAPRHVPLSERPAASNRAPYKEI